MSSEKLIDLEKRLSRICIQMLPRLKVEQIINESDFEQLFICLDDLKEYMHQKTDIPRSLVSKLFLLYFSVNKALSFIPTSEQTNEVYSRLTIGLAAIFDDNYLS
ncbi:hypothetical protein B5M42_015235 [Paenibacillus athensensis]|uniref:Uncharacterized protein n=1 Tax=Paenibacillus athensensis TaxID=1967502 RepID=A0A4Y8PTW3_9BACL|nr:hypothetical protein [Paenibacillus athensensis]MCD1260166.1 hypothetical protein [Paenibacillus athensensis]